MALFLKDKDAVLDYVVNWTVWLNGDTIVTSIWLVPTGITKDSDTKTTATTTIWLSSGAVKQTYAVVNRITTAGGRTEDRTLHIRVIEK